MAVWVDQLLDAPGRPASVTWAAVLGAVAGGVVLPGTAIVGVVVFTAAGATWFAVTVAVLAVVQVTAVVLLFVGSARLAMGAGRGVLLGGLALTLLACAAHGLHAVTLVAGDPDESPTVVAIFLTIAVGIAALSAGSLFFALRATTSAYVSCDPQHAGRR
jgi:hypothetical protein